jgi:hypothetical protein
LIRTHSVAPKGRNGSHNPSCVEEGLSG